MQLSCTPDCSSHTGKRIHWIIFTLIVVMDFTGGFVCGQFKQQQVYLQGPCEEYAFSFDHGERFLV
jgi:hypothetical protein